MMVQEPHTIRQEFIVLVQTGNNQLEKLVKGTIQEKNVHFIKIKTSDEINEQQTNGKIAAFIIGSDIGDPIQSAQRLHVISNQAKIVLLAQNDKGVQALREAVKFSPFIGSDVICLNESGANHLAERLTTVLAESLNAERYRSIIAESNLNLFPSGKQLQPAFSQHFINKLMDIAPIGIVIVSIERKVLGWNAKAASIFQRYEAQMLGRSILQLFNESEGRKLNSYLSKNFHENDVNKVNSLTIEKAEKNDKQFLNITAAPFTYSEENQSALILAIKDVTKREKALKELQEMNITLEERVKERTESLLAYQDQLRLLASKLSKAEENERQRLATELHDNLGQMLAVCKMKISALLNYPMSDKISLEIENIKEELNDALKYTRHLMSDLKPPPSLNQEDIAPSINWLAEKMEKQQLQVTLQDDGHPKLVNDEIRTTLVQSVRELLFNVIKHSGVKQVDVKLIRLKNMVHIIVQDKGKGFVKEAEQSASDIKGFGLFNISERLDLLGGNLKIETAPGEGTKVTLCAPLKE